MQQKVILTVTLILVILLFSQIALANPLTDFLDKIINFFSRTKITGHVTGETCHTSPLWSWGYCSKTCKCDAGEGDCDRDTDCNTGYCAQNVGANYGQSKWMDVCEVVTPECTTSKDCMWCGQGCVKKQPDLVCIQISPPKDYQCICEDGRCMKKKIEKSITVLSPDGGEEWIQGKTYNITWTSTDSINKVGITILENHQPYQDPSGAYMETIVTDNDGSYAWTVDIEPLDNAYTVKIEDEANSSVYDESDDYFSVIAEEIPVCTDSDGGKNYYVKGTTSRTGPNPLTVEDFCDTSFAGFNLREYYCDSNNEIQSVQYNCSYSCKDGACVYKSKTFSISLSNFTILPVVGVSIYTSTASTEYTTISGLRGLEISTGISNSIVSDPKWLSEGESTTAGDLTLKLITAYSGTKAKVEVTDSSGAIVWSGMITSTETLITYGSDTYKIKVLDTDVATTAATGIAQIVFGKGDVSYDKIYVLYNDEYDLVAYYDKTTNRIVKLATTVNVTITTSFAKITILPVVGQTIYNSTDPTSYSTTTGLEGLKISTDLSNSINIDGTTCDKAYFLFDDGHEWLGYYDKTTNRKVSIDAQKIIVRAPVCTDSDGGFKLDIKGVATDVDGSATDECVYLEEEGKWYLKEYWCDDVSGKKTYGGGVYNCEAYGYDACRDGACMSEEFIISVSTDKSIYNINDTIKVYSNTSLQTNESCIYNITVLEYDLSYFEYDSCGYWMISNITDFVYDNFGFPAYGKWKIEVTASKPGYPKAKDSVIIEINETVVKPNTYSQTQESICPTQGCINSVIFTCSDNQCNPSSDGTLTISLKGDYDARNEYTKVYIDNKDIGEVGSFGKDNLCPPKGWWLWKDWDHCKSYGSKTFTISQSQLKSYLADGFLEVKFVDSRMVNHCCNAEHKANLEFSYR